MPGIRSLKDGEFIRAFQVIDKIIQNNHPIFIIVWVGSVLSFFILIVFAYFAVDNFYFFSLTILFLVYFLGVQLPTVTINVPLNNKLQAIDVNKLNDSELKKSRNEFEIKWNRSNNVRSLISIFTSILLLIVLLKI